MNFKFLFTSLILVVISCVKKTNCDSLNYIDNFTLLKGKFFTGECEKLYPSRKIYSNQRYFNGLDHGRWKFYFENGNLKTEAHFSQGKRVGNWKFYYENGSLWKDYFYKNGKKDSIWRTFDEDGNLIEEVNFQLKAFN